MENEKLPTRMGTVAYRTTGRHASFQRFCELFEINLEKPFDKDSRISAECSAHIFKFQIFAILYEQDYYRKKSPQEIAAFLGRKTDNVLGILQKIRPNYFINGVYTPKENHNLRYLSSFEVDKHLGGNYDFLSYK
ncbi:hypothetical protein [Chryseobacterium sp.]|uniref:hypothetical protein n=1 Tax=Chryseobacterium sp. TaxID=1871047 RepID=UPI0011C94828|nr:hypothetical protein [Chryseobacterium sp.]TXF74980.1 hypothetical protein FUA25_11905 [Chryseobacterium sp.]